MRDITFDVNVVPIRLPSNGTGKQGLVEVSLRPMTAQDEKLLTNKVLIKKGVVQDELMKRVIVGGKTRNGEEVEVDYYDLYIEDVYALLLTLRMISYGLDYDVEVRCPECNAKSELIINLETDINVTYAPEDLPFEQTITLPLSKKAVTFHYPTQRDESENDIELVANCIIEPPAGIPREAIDMWLKNLVAGDWSALRKAISNPPFGASKKIDFVCSKCGEENKILMPVQSSFFRFDTR